MSGSRGVWGPLLIRFLISPRRGRSGGHCALSALFAVPLEALRQPDAFPVEGIDLTVMGQSIQQGCRQSGVAEDLGPFGEGQVGCHQDRGPFVAIGEDLKQQLGSLLGERDVTELIDLCGAPHKWTHVKTSVM